MRGRTGNVEQQVFRSSVRAFLTCGSFRTWPTSEIKKVVIAKDLGL
jgi:hypothetical protein